MLVMNRVYPLLNCLSQNMFMFRSEQQWSQRSLPVPLSVCVWAWQVCGGVLLTVEDEGGKTSFYDRDGKKGLGSSLEGRFYTSGKSLWSIRRILYSIHYYIFFQGAFSKLRTPRLQTDG